MLLYHRCTVDAALAILGSGFRDGVGSYMTRNQYSGVWLSDKPLDINEGAEGDVLLLVDVDLRDDELGNYEWVEQGKGFREFLLPSDVANQHARVSVEDVEICWLWAGPQNT